MQYMCLIYDDEQVVQDMGEEDGTDASASTAASPSRSARAAAASAGDALQPTSTATTVRIRDGKTLVTDGPFAETKEQLGGYYLIEAKDVDEAIEDRRADPGRALRLDRGAAGRSSRA